MKKKVTLTLLAGLIVLGLTGLTSAEEKAELAIRLTEISERPIEPAEGGSLNLPRFVIADDNHWTGLGAIVKISDPNFRVLWLRLRVFDGAVPRSLRGQVVGAVAGTVIAVSCVFRPIVITDSGANVITDSGDPDHRFRAS